MLKNLPCNAGDMGLIPGRKTKIPVTRRQLSLCAETKNLHAATKTQYRQLKIYIVLIEKNQYVEQCMLVCV